MKTKIHKPWYEGNRYYPTAKRIAAELLAHDGLLNLRTRRLLPDIQERYKVSFCTAMKAIGLARDAIQFSRHNTLERMDDNHPRNTGTASQLLLDA